MYVPTLAVVTSFIVVLPLFIVYVAVPDNTLVDSPDINPVAVYEYVGAVPR